MRDFEGRVAVVTGAASGIGRAFAERFGREGMKVVLADVERDALDAAVRELRTQELDVLGVVTDVSSPASVEGLAKQTLDAYGGVHLLCNNAGVLGDPDPPDGPPTRLWEHSLKEWQWMFGVNVWGVVHGIHTFLPIMLAQDEPGHVVNTASVAGLTSGSRLGIYGATKHAVVRISEALYAQLTEIGAKVGASVLCPGGVETRIQLASRNRPDELRDEAPRLTPEQIAARERERTARRVYPQMAPAEVAERVLRAVQEEQFYILTHDQHDDQIRERMEDIRLRRNPRPREM